MSLAQYALNAGLLVFILASNLGTRAVTRWRLAMPVVLVVVAGGVLLRDVPTVGGDVRIEAFGVAAGLLLGVVAGVLVRVRQEPGGLVMVAGTGYAALWTLVIGGRMVFAFGADHWFAAGIGRFSYDNGISGADAWTTAFVLMALTMVLTRVAVTSLAVFIARRDPAAVPA
jgi:hypothetical protein